MSYETGTASSPADLMSKLNTFLTGTPGWTADLAPGGNSRAVWSKAGVSAKIFVWWDSNNLALGMIQTFNGDLVGTAQGGFEFTSDTITNNRYVNNMPGPYPSYHFFEDDDYIHVALEISTGIYRHFGWGQLLKLGSWTGGMYVYGHFWNQNSFHIDDATSPNHAVHLGGRNQLSLTQGCGVHAEGLPDNLAATKYLRQTTSTVTNDDDGDRIGNVFPAGWQDGQNVHFMATQASELNEFKPLIPIPIYQWSFTPSPDTARLLGYAPDVRDINMFGLNNGQELTVASDTWLVFPVTRKGNDGTSFNQEQSYNFGFAYKKVTT